MSIETLLERIAVAGESQARALAGLLQIQLGTLQGPVAEVEDREEPESHATPDPDELSYAEKRKAEIAAEAKAKKEAEKAAADAVKKKPGRPAGSKNAEKVKEEVKPPVVEEDPFADAPAEEFVYQPATLDDVRKVLVELRLKCVAKLGDGPGKEKAYSILRDAGKGASYLKGSTAGGATPGGAGELKEANYSAVVKAARDWIENA